MTHPVIGDVEAVARDRVALADVTPPLAAYFGDDLCLIWSGQWGSWWMQGGYGYTRKREAAGRFTITDAYARTRHCGPEKAIYFERAAVREHLLANDKGGE